MELEIKNVFDHEFEDMEKVVNLNNSAFPEDERMDIELFVKRSKTHQVEFYAVYKDGVFVGFFNLMIYKSIAYVMFLAVEENMRNLGLGTEILKLIAKKYSEYQIVLDLEVQDENAQNSIQRQKRKAFYLRNKFVETGYILEYDDVKLELLCFNSNEFKSDEFTSLMNSVSNEYFRPVVYKK